MRYVLLMLCWLVSPEFDAQVNVQFDIRQTDSSLRLNLFRMYVTHIELAYADGTHYQDSCPAYLLDSEDSVSLQLVLAGAPQKPVKSVHFLLGTDSLTNVSGILDGALDPIRGMYWAWNTGYINAKLEGEYAGTPFEFHVGGYLSPFGTSRQISVSPEAGHPIRIALFPDHLIREAFSREIHLLLIPGENAAWLADRFYLLFQAQ